MSTYEWGCHICLTPYPTAEETRACAARCRRFECDLHLNCDTIVHCRQRMDAWVKRNLLADAS